MADEKLLCRDERQQLVKKNENSHVCLHYSSFLTVTMGGKTMSSNHLVKPLVAFFNLAGIITDVIYNCKKCICTFRQ